MIRSPLSHHSCRRYTASSCVLTSPPCIRLTRQAPSRHNHTHHCNVMHGVSPHKMAHSMAGDNKQKRKTKQADREIMLLDEVSTKLGSNLVDSMRCNAIVGGDEINDRLLMSSPEHERYNSARQATKNRKPPTTYVCNTVHLRRPRATFPRPSPMGGPPIVHPFCCVHGIGYLVQFTTDRSNRMRVLHVPPDSGDTTRRNGSVAFAHLTTHIHVIIP